MFWLEVFSYVLLIDSALAVAVAWYGQRWYSRRVGIVACYLPPAKGWAVWYFLLAMLIFWLIISGT